MKNAVPPVPTLIVCAVAIPVDCIFTVFNVLDKLTVDAVITPTVMLGVPVKSLANVAIPVRLPTTFPVKMPITFP